ncbi:MAG: hypothetical protein JWQ96_1132 [Segetibacter sp.]|nr:hypothetical protein [Segetibacter sp.]
MKVAGVFAFILLFNSCISFSDKRVKLSREYYAWSMEGGSDMQIYYWAYDEYNIGMFGPRVYAAGVDSSFIIAKKHPKRDGKIEKRTTLFYIIPLKQKVSKEGEKNYYGPYMEMEFNEMRKQLGVRQDLRFTINL